MAEELQREHHPHVDVCTGIFNNPIFSDRVLKIQTKDGTKDMYMHVSSGLLASKSKFFFKLLSNGMKETNENQIILQINAKYERDVVIELLKFMHDNELSPATMASNSHLLSLLRFADMYDVTSCVNYCINTLLPRLPMSLESAALILDLPSSLLTSYDQSIKAFVNKAKKFILNCYGDMNKLKEEVASLPLPVVELVLCWDGLLASEDEIYDILLTWTRANYPNIKRRRNFLKLNLNRFVRVGYMTYSKVKALCVCEDLHPEVAKDIVIDALLFKGQNPSPHMHTLMVRAETDQYYYPVEVVEFRKSSQGFMVSLTMEEETIMKWTPNELKHTKTFVFGGLPFHLEVCRSGDQFFGVQLCMTDESVCMTGIDVNVGFRITFKQVGRYLEENTVNQVELDERERTVKVKFPSALHRFHPTVFYMRYPKTLNSYFADKIPSSIYNMLHLRANVTIEQNPHM